MNAHGIQLTSIQNITNRDKTNATISKKFDIDVFRVK